MKFPPIPDVGQWVWIFIVLSYLAVGLGCYFLARLNNRSQYGKESNKDQEGTLAKERQQERKMIQRYRFLLENTRDIILFVRVSDGGILEANNAAVQVYGYELRELLSKRIIDLRAPETRHLVEQQLKQAKQSGIAFETLHQRKDGSIFPVEINSASVILDNENVLISIIRDISERRRIEERLQETEEIFNQFLEHSPIYVFFKDEKIRSLRLSRNYEAMLGRPLDELLGKDMNDLFPSDLAKNMIADDIRILNEGREIVIEEELNERFYRTIKFPIHVVGKARYLAGYTMDITEQKRSERALIENNKHLQTIISGAPIVLFSVDRNGIFTLSEGRGIYDLEKMVGQVVGQSMFDVFHNQPEQLDNLRRALSGETFQTRVDIFGQSYDAYHTPLLDEQGKCVGTIGVLVDITQQKHAEEIVVKRAAELATVAEISTAASTVLDTGVLLQNAVDLICERFALYHTHIYMLNDTGDTLVLTAGAGELGHRMVSGGHSIAVNLEHSLVARAARTRRSVIINDVSCSPDFLPNPLLPNTHSEMAIPLIFGDALLGVLDVQADRIDHFSDEDIHIHTTLAAQISNSIQNARQYQQILATASRLESIQNAINEGAIVLITDVNGKIEFANENMFLFSGYARDELMGVDLHVLDSKYQDGGFVRGMWDTIAAGKVWRGELYNRIGEGVHWVDTTASPIFNENGKPVKYIFVGFDVTKRKQAEDALRTNEARYRAIVDGTTDLICRFLPDTTLTFVNEAYCRYFGQSREQLIGMPFLSLVPESGWEDVQAHVDTVIRKKEPVTYSHEVITPAGELRWQQWTDSTILNEQGDIVELQSVGRDITEGKRMEEAFRDSHNLLRIVLDTIPVRIFWKDTNLRYLGCNQPFAMDAGAHSPEELIGRDDYQMSWREQADLYRSDDRQVLETGIPKYNYEEPQTTPTGSRIWLRTTKVPLRRADGSIHGILGTYEDVTERKLIEEEREALIAELESKNAELERFTYTVSHDLKSPLVTINGFLGFLKQDIASGDMERFNNDIERIGNATKKMEKLLWDLLELSRIGRLVKPSEDVSFNDLIRETLEIVHGQLEARKVTVHVQPNLPTVYGDRQRLMEVLQNLVDNASKYMGKQEDPHIDIGLRGVEGDTYVFFVRDNGIGIAPEHHERIFGLFNKLDMRSEGTGVGLALVKRIIDFHGGRIWVESEAGRGATFLFTLPCKPGTDSVI